jgi:hypothetical protein
VSKTSFFHADAADVVFKSEIETVNFGHRPARLRLALKRSPLTYLRRSVQGYKRIAFAR